jgi:methylenetetrahydrofolate reductase (NADPH)
MQIKEIFKKKKPVISLEIFPPKPESPVDTIFKTIDELKDLKPDFISVTYGALGSSKDNTLKIADVIKNQYHIEALAHLTCITASKNEINALLQEFKAHNIENILAMRGDIPKDYQINPENPLHYRYAKDLIQDIKLKDGFSIGAACYPEGHIECSKHADIKYLREKVQCGVDFLITQLFLDNELFYQFMEKLDLMGVEIPVSAGIMPVINKNQIERITSLCGASMPPKFKRMLDRYGDNPEALKDAGISYATEQIIDLLTSGVSGIHLYTMNRASVARKIITDISSIRNFFECERKI